MTVPLAAVARLREDLSAALGRAVAAADIIAIAVSGGPDSMALLALAAAAWPGQVIAATVDHGLRAAAADEAAMVAAYCMTLACTPADAGVRSRDGGGDARRPPTARSEAGPRRSPEMCAGRGVPHAMLKPVTPLATANVQANARTARYKLLTDWAIASGVSILATAHHADDQAETFLMRAARGSGLAGLSGIRPSRRLADTLMLVRPLLGWRCNELRDIVIAGGIPFVDDPSNADDHYDRTRFRALLKDNDWLDPLHLARSAGYAGEGHEALEAMTVWLWQARKVIRRDVEDCDDQTWLNLADLPREIKRRLVREAIDGVRTINGIVRPPFSSAANIEPLLDAVTGGKPATQAGILVSRAGDIWHFRAAPPRRDTAQAHS